MRTHRSEAGFSLAAVIFFATAVSIMIAAAVPVYQFQAKRQMEEELIFRGEEYTRAIAKYQRRFGVYPASIDQLVATNGLRFLRKPYKDPITGKDFRLITINPDGSVNGSKVFKQNTNNQSLFGNTSVFGQQGSQLPGQQQGQGQGTGQQQNQPQGQQFGTQGQSSFLGQGQQQSQSSFMGQSQSQGFGSSGQQSQGFRGGNAPSATNPFSGQGFGNSGSSSTGQGFNSGQGFSSGQGFARGPTSGNPGSLGNATGTPTAVAGIIGVASDSELESIKIYNNRQKYDEWEFVAIPGQQGQRGLPQQGVPGQQPGSQQQNPFNQTGTGRQPNPFQNGTSNGFGTQSPFGSSNSQQQGQQSPFGFGPQSTSQPRK
jgi:hypothetical protein